MTTESPHRRRFQFSPFLLLLVRLLFVLIALFGLLRAGLIARNWSPGLASGWEVARAFLVGVRFDLSIACYLCIPLMIAAYVPWTSPAAGPRRQRAYVWCATLMVSVLGFILLAEFEFFREFQSRFDQVAVGYVNQPKIVGGMIWYNYPVLRYVLVWLVLATLIRLGIGWAVKRSFPTQGQALTKLWREVAIAPVVILAIVIGARGGLQHEPLRWGNAFNGENEFTNQMSLNGLFSLSQAIRDVVYRGRAGAAWRKGRLAQDDRAVARSMIVAGGEHVIDPHQRTMLRTGDSGSSLRLRRADGKPVNVVVVMMESFSARYVASCGSPVGVTPSFDALARDGVLFDRFLSAGSHTHQGIFATMLGFPNLPSYERLMELGISNQEFLGFAEVFAARGYDTYFLYNGDLAWDNMRGFFRKQAVKHFIGGDDMIEGAKYRDAVWGVSDGDLFERANREFEAASKKGPFMAAIMTLSNHAPFQVPPVPGTEPITAFGEDNKRLEALRYADYAIGQFIEEAKKLSYFKDTLFVFVGDHGFHVAPKLTEVHLLYHHVPLLFYAPGLTDRRGVDHRVATQMDILPSVVGLLGLNESQQSAWGRSLFNDSFGDGGVAVFKMSTGRPAVALARGDKVLVMRSPTDKPKLMQYSLGFPPSVTPLVDPAMEKSMERELRAYVGSALEDLIARRAGPMSPADESTSKR